MSTDIVPTFNAFAAKENISIFLFLRFQARPNQFIPLLNESSVQEFNFFTVFFSESVKNSFIIH